MTGFISLRGRIGLGILLFLALPHLPVQSQDSLQYNWERFSVSLGGFLTTANCNLSLDDQSGLGVNINMEQALGLNTTNFVFRGEVAYNFGSHRRSHVRLGYFGFFRSSRKTLDAELEIGDNVYQIGTELVSNFDMMIVRGMYDYSYFRDGRIMLAVSAGLYLLPMDFAIKTDSIINEGDSFVAPLPVIGFQNSFMISPKFILKQNIEVMYYRDKYFKGNISDFNVWLEYIPFKHFGFGLGYNAFRFNFTSYEELGRRDFNGSLSTGFTGLLFYGKFYL